MVSAIVAALAMTTPPGGLCVQAGAGNLDEAIRLAKGGHFLVEVLDSDLRRVETARQRIEEAGLYGLVSANPVASFDHLPLSEYLVNLLLLQTPELVPVAEVQRLLCPGGSARTITGTTLVSKPRPPNLDDWTHPRHGADGNPVSRDTEVGPPRRVRWVTGPPFRSTGLLSAGGRNFYSGMLARDSFNGLTLWKESLIGSSASDGSEIVAPNLPAVALENLVLAPRRASLVALQSATGELIREFKEIVKPQEFRVSGRLFVAALEHEIAVGEIDTGKLRWKLQFERPRYLAIGKDAVFFLHGRPERGQPVSIECRALAGGTLHWNHEESWARAVKGMVFHEDRLALEVSTLSDAGPGNSIPLAL